MDFLSLLPPFLTIAIALVYRKVITALIFGIFSGSILIAYKSSLHLQSIILPIKSVYNSVSNTDHLTVIVFSIAIAAMVGAINGNGSMHALVNRISKYAKSAKSTQLITYLLGLLIFFDDYANTLVVGNSMQKLSDKYNVSRAKLAYIVDSTAAPVAAIAFITTWIGAEIGYIEQSLEQLSLNENAYLLFINSLQYSFYPLLTLVFVPMLIISGKDFGPMLNSKPIFKTNNSAFETKNGEAKSYQALLPILSLIGLALSLIIYSGWDASMVNTNQNVIGKLSFIIGNSDSYFALLWSSIVSLLLSITIKKEPLKKSLFNIYSGVKNITSAIVILILAWTLAEIISQLGTANYLVHLIHGFEFIYLLPVIVFVLSAIVSFATGSSWGTMAILYPIVLPTVWAISQNSGMDYDLALNLFSNIIACVLAGSVLGDHCSPISDTTILSSMASGCSHIEHVKTQLPYALTVGLVSVVCLLLANILPSFICLLTGIILLKLIIRFI